MPMLFLLEIYCDGINDRLYLSIILAVIAILCIRGPGRVCPAMLRRDCQM